MSKCTNKLCKFSLVLLISTIIIPTSLLTPTSSRAVVITDETLYNLTITNILNVKKDINTDETITAQNLIAKDKVTATNGLNIPALGTGVIQSNATGNLFSSTTVNAATLNAATVSATTINATGAVTADIVNTTNINSENIVTDNINVNSTVNTETVNATDVSATNVETQTVSAETVDTATENATTINSTTLNSDTVNSDTVNATSLVLQNGEVSTPALRFADNEGSGIWLSEGEKMNFSSNGTNQMSIAPGQIKAETKILATDGYIFSPAISFSSDTYTGIYHTAPRTINFSSYGVNQMSIYSTGVNMPGAALNCDGTTTFNGKTITNNSTHYKKSDALSITQPGSNPGCQIITFSDNSTLNLSNFPNTSIFLLKNTSGAARNLTLGLNNGETDIRVVSFVNISTVAADSIQLVASPPDSCEQLVFCNLTPPSYLGGGRTAVTLIGYDTNKWTTLSAFNNAI